MAIAAIRYNNPGNVSLPIRGYDGPGTVVGIRGQSGYASFPTMQDGLRAQAARITSYIDGSTRYGARTTIAQLNGVYAEDQNWRNNVSRYSGIGVNERLDPNNAQQMAALQGGIIRSETGRDPSVFGFNPGTGLGTSAPMNSNNPTDGLGYGNASGGYGEVGTRVESYSEDGRGGASVTLGFDNGTPQTGTYEQGVDGSSFAGSTNVGSALGALAQKFGLNVPGLSNILGSSGSGGGSGQTAAGSMTVPQAIDKQTSGVTKQSASDTASLNKQSAANTKSQTDTAKGIYSSLSSSWSDYFVRIVFIVVGLIALAAALMLFKPVQNAAVTVASRIPKVPV